MDWLTISTLVLALATFTLAGLTAWNVRETKRAALAAERSADVAAATVAEIRADRELSCRPYVTWKLAAGTHVNAANLGRGPALNTIFCGVNEDFTWRGTAADLLCDFSPGQEIATADDIKLELRMGAAPPMPQFAGQPGRILAFCEDQLGNRLRFARGLVEADIWRPGTPKPDWVIWYESNAKVAPRA